MTVLKVFSERRYTSGYIVRDELWECLPGDGEVRVRVAYTPNGEYIGTSREAHFLCTTLGITPELASPTSPVCTIGYSKKKRWYYGWSHRAIVGFKRGDQIFDAAFGNDHTPFIKHGAVTIRTRDDMRQAAINFANYIG